MSNNTRKLLRIISLIIVLVIVFMQLDILNIRWAPLHDNIIWLMVISYFMLLIASR